MTITTIDDLVTPTKFIQFLRELEAEVTEDLKIKEMLAEEDDGVQEL